MLKIYKCRNYKRTTKWMEVKAGHPALAAQLYAEEFFASAGDVITVMNHGKYQIEMRIVIRKI